MTTASTMSAMVEKNAIANAGPMVGSEKAKLSGMPSRSSSKLMMEIRLSTAPRPKKNGQHGQPFGAKLHGLRRRHRLVRRRCLRRRLRLCIESPALRRRRCCAGSACGSALGASACTGSACGSALGASACTGSACGSALGASACRLCLGRFRLAGWVSMVWLWPQDGQNFAPSGSSCPQRKQNMKGPPILRAARRPFS